ncbi:hypothetical protein [Xenorhabdus cabanillasii]|uniref:hypothetical protein n=1 Tax=Xenorhabdus cabanillasii TaxID=351673 RepID=UPI0031452550
MKKSAMYHWESLLTALFVVALTVFTLLMITIMATGIAFARTQTNQRNHLSNTAD